MALRYKNLEFFNKEGISYNFDYNTEQERWTGSIYLPRVSSGLFEVEHIFLYERILDSNNVERYAKPHIFDYKTTNEIVAYWSDKYLDDQITIYDISESKYIETIKNQIFELDHSTSDLFIDNNLQSDIINPEFLKLNISINSDTEGIYERELIIKDINDDHIIAEIYVYGEVIGEDERLKVLCNNLGYLIDKDDERIFSESDINEDNIDYILLNRKRKEILLEGSNIYPFIGSYKGLINAINYFGFDELDVKEYWVNVNKESKDYGKYKQNDVLEIFNSDVDLNRKLIDTVNYRKTNNISLVYRLHTVDNDSMDKYDYPVVRENFTYTFEEVLIKLYSLKEKLKREFIPFNINIKDVVGEGTYFSKLNKTATTSYSNAPFLVKGVTPQIKLQTTNNKIIDLRNTYDLLTQYDFDPYFEHSLVDRLDDTIEDVGEYVLALFKDYYPTINKVELLPDKPDIPIGCPVVIENTTFNIAIKDINTTLGSFNTDNDFYIEFEVLNPYIGDKYVIKDELSGVSIEYTVSGTMTEDQITEELYNLFLAESRLPFPLFLPEIVVKDTKKYLRISAVDISTNKIRFDFQSWAERADGVIEQKLNKYFISLNSNYTLKNIGRINYYEVEWIITNKERNFEHRIIGDVNQYKTIFLNLPYTGSYDVDIILRSTNNIVSRRLFPNFINVELSNSDFLGAYRFVNDGEPDIKSLKDIKFNENKLVSYKPLVVNDTKLRDCQISFRNLKRVGLLPNNNPTDNFLYTVQNYRPNLEINYPGPFTFGAIGDKIQMKDLKHVTNKMTQVTGDAPASFDIKEINVGGTIQIIDYLTNERGYHVFETDDLKLAIQELNNSKDKIISRYNYNYIDNDEGHFPDSDKHSYIHVAGKYYGHNCDWKRVESSGLVIENIELSRTYGYRFNDFKILKDFKVFDGVVYIQFAADNCKVAGKKKWIWTVDNVTADEWETLEFYGDAFGYLFHIKGNYKIGLTVEDSNGNRTTSTKNMLIIK